MTELIANGRQIAAAPLRSVGAKAAALTRLNGWGVRVPDFFVVRSEAFGRFLGANGLPWPPPAGALPSAVMPDEIIREVTSAYQALSLANTTNTVSVRSSGADEDSEQDSFAGQFDSYLGVSGAPNLVRAIKKCWASALSERSAAYRSARGLSIGTEPNFGVIVQTQIFSQKAGVLFTVHPMDPDSAYIEANFGTGESVVGSLVTPDGVTISRTGGTVVETRIANKRRMTQVVRDQEASKLVEIEESMRRHPVLTTSEAQELFAVAMGIEQHAGRPQDVEWAIDEEGIWILQARPITAATGAFD